MATSYPASLDAFTNPGGTTKLGTAVGGRTHSQFHADINDAVEALQARLGTTTTVCELVTTGGIRTRQAATQDAMRLLGRAGGTSSYTMTLTPATLGASRTWSFPDRDDTVAGLGAQTFTGAQTISNTTESSSLGTGALVVAGGASVAKVLRVGDTIVGSQALNIATSGDFGGAILGRGDAGLGFGQFLKLINSGAGTDVVVFNDASNHGVRFEQSSGTLTYGIGSKFGVAGPGDYFSISRYSAGWSTLATFDANGLLVLGAAPSAPGATEVKIGGGELKVGATTASTSTITGALTVDGGVGVAEQVTARRGAVATATISTTGVITALSSSDGFARLTGAAQDIQGIAAPGGEAQLLTLYCVNATTLRHENAGASAANRIASDTGADISVSAGKTVQLIYDPTSARWRPVRF